MIRSIIAGVMLVISILFFTYIVVDTISSVNWSKEIGTFIGNIQEYSEEVTNK